MHDLAPSPSRGAAATDRADHALVPFFLLTIALTIPFWVLGAVSGLQLLPGLPVAALAAFCPAAAAAILVDRRRGAAGVLALLKRSVDLRLTLWLAPTLLLMPLVMALSYGLQRLVGEPVPPPQITLSSAAVLVVVTLVAALGEELGWSGYAIDPMQARWGALAAALGMGAFWAAYHFAGLAQAHRSVLWIAEWTVGTVALRVIITWLYNNTGGSVLTAALFHMTINVTWLLFPVAGSHYDPGVTSAILAVVAALVVVGWGPRTLVRT
ncbi:MAG: CPBP family intramembrane metalloprotease [Candidatus Dormibacteraeota bacterium]|nr:CPBP family intramembrane metalloprotease [Candidatus Dormibacteraeota bacterium]